MNKLRKKKGRSNRTKIWKAVLDTTNPKLQKKALDWYPYWRLSDGIKSRLNLPEFWRCGNVPKVFLNALRSIIQMANIVIQRILFYENILMPNMAQVGEKSKDFEKYSRSKEDRTKHHASQFTFHL